MAALILSYTDGPSTKPISVNPEWQIEHRLSCPECPEFNAATYDLRTAFRLAYGHDKTKDH